MLKSRGRWGAWGIGGGRAAAALASARAFVTCGMLALLVGMQQLHSLIKVELFSINYWA